MENIEKGKKEFLTMTITLLAISVFTTLISIGSKSGFKLVEGIIRTGLEGMLLYCIFKGKKWAKIIMIILLSITILLDLVVVIFSMKIMFIIMLVVYCGSLYVMAFSSDVKEYLKSVNS